MPETADSRESFSIVVHRQSATSRCRLCSNSESLGGTFAEQPRRLRPLRRLCDFARTVTGQLCRTKGSPLPLEAAGRRLECGPVATRVAVLNGCGTKLQREVGARRQDSGRRCCLSPQFSLLSTASAVTSWSLSARKSFRSWPHNPPLHRLLSGTRSDFSGSTVISTFLNAGVLD